MEQSSHISIAKRTEKRAIIPDDLARIPEIFDAKAAKGAKTQSLGCCGELGKGTGDNGGNGDLKKGNEGNEEGRGAVG